MTSHVEATQLISQPGYPTYALSKIGGFAGGDCYIHLTATVLTIITQYGTEVATWPYATIRDFDCHDDIFTFTSGRKGPFGVEKYDFRFVPLMFEGFKSALSMATGAKFGQPAPILGSPLSSSAVDTPSNQCYVSHPPKLMDNTNGVVQTDFVLSRLSSTSSSSSSSSCSSSSSVTENYLVPLTLRKQLSAPSLKRIVHQYEEVDLPAASNSLSNSPSTSPSTYAASNASAGDVHAMYGPKRTLSHPSSFEDIALPSAPGRIKTIPSSLIADTSSAARSNVPVEQKLSTVYENINPYHHYDFVPLRHSTYSEPRQGSWDPSSSRHGRMQLLFISGSGEEVLYDVPQSALGGTLPLVPPGKNALSGPYENIQPESNFNVSTPGAGGDEHPYGFRRLPPSATSAPLHHQYVNLVGLSTQLVQDMPTIGGGKAPLPVQSRPTTLYPPKAVVAGASRDPSTADDAAKNSTSPDDDYVHMFTSELRAWPAKLDVGQVSMGVEPGEEDKDGYVVVRGPIYSSSVREPTFIQGHDGMRDGASEVKVCIVPAAKRAGAAVCADAL